MLQHQLCHNSGAPSSHPKTSNRTNAFRRCGWAEAETRHLTSMSDRATSAGVWLLGGQKEHTTKGTLIANKPDKMTVLAQCPPLMLKAKVTCAGAEAVLSQGWGGQSMCFSCKASLAVESSSWAVQHRVATCTTACSLNQKARRRDVFVQHYWRLSQEWCYSHLGTRGWSPRLLSQFLLRHVSGYVSPGSVMEISAPH